MSTAPAGKLPPGFTLHDGARQWLPDDPDDYRMRFERDYDRLVHTSAFRRLQGKTQVVTPGEADFFRTRLTHSIEVAQVAQRLAEIVGANPELCEASAILHDLGHPPFGHVGEEVLGKALDTAAKAWKLDPVADVGGFNGNAQSFRLAVKTLSQSQDFGGLDLTRAVLDGAIKYPYRREEQGPADSHEHWCFYPTEAAEAIWVRDQVPAARQFKKSLEAEIVDWADDVAYSIHDVEDWYRAGFMPLEMLAQNAAFRANYAKRVAQEMKVKNFTRAQVEAAVDDFFGGLIFREVQRGYDGSDEVKEGIRTMRKALFTEFTQVAIADTAAPRKRHQNNLNVVGARTRLHNRILKRLLWDFVIAHPRMATHQMGQAHVVAELFQLHVDALAFDPKKGRIDTREARLDIYPPDLRARLTAPATLPAELLRLVADRISGMTDDYALRLHGRLTGAVPGAFNAFV